MPKLPTIGPGQSQPQRGAPPSSFGAEAFRSLANFGGELQNIALTIQHQDDELEVTRLRGQFEKGLSDIATELDQEPNFSARPQMFTEQAQKLQKSLLGQSDRQPVKQAFSIYAGEALPQHIIQMKARSLELWNNDQLSKIDSIGEDLAAEAARATTPEDRDRPVQLYEDLINRSVQRGMIIPTEGEKRKQAFHQNVQYGSALHDARTDPEGTKAEIGTRYPDLDAVAREKIIDRADVEIRRRKEADTNSLAESIGMDQIKLHTPADETDLMNEADVMKSVRENTKDADVIKSAGAIVHNFVLDWNQRAAQKYDEYSNSVYKAAADGKPLADILATSEFQNLKGKDQAAFKDYMLRQGSKHDEETKDAQTIRWGELISDPEGLQNTDLNKELISGAISREQFNGLMKAKEAANPLRSDRAKTAIALIDKNGSQRIFNYDDRTDNLAQWNRTKRLLQTYIENNWTSPDYNPEEFVAKLLEPVEETWAQHLLDLRSLGTPGLKEAQDVKMKALEKEAGMDPKRRRAIDELTKAGESVTESNIKYVMDQLK